MPHPETSMTRPCDLTAVEARALIGNKQLSPVELLDSCIEQVERIDGELNAVVVRDFDRAREDAREAENAVMHGGPFGLLHGLPVGIKDLNDTAGLRTTYGSLLFKDHVPERDDLMVANLRRCGAVVMGKTNTPEFGAGGNTSNKLFGATRNPFDTALTCGGSSGGSAVALATNMMPLASGSDTGGSLRLPAAFCGVVAHRGSPGLVVNDHRSQAYSTYQMNGPMARTVDDVSLMLAAVSIPDDADPMRSPQDSRGLTQLPGPGTPRPRGTEHRCFDRPGRGTRVPGRTRDLRVPRE
jgi:Asp-tRNA(Asn)/Glu-tRNA(Gln) amidotransferase A subunit family amidase